MSPSPPTPTAQTGTLSGQSITVSNNSSLARSVPGILRDGLAAHGSAMVVRALPATQEPVRAVVASRKVGGAVARNRAKRRLREAVRAAGVPADLDLVVIARAASLIVPMPQLVAEAHDLVQRLSERMNPDGGRP